MEFIHEILLNTTVIENKRFKLHINQAEFSLIRPSLYKNKFCNHSINFLHFNLNVSIDRRNYSRGTMSFKFKCYINLIFMLKSIQCFSCGLFALQIFHIMYALVYVEK